MSAQVDLKQFKARFEQQFDRDPELGLRVRKIIDNYFHETTSPDLLVYEASLVADKPLFRNARREVNWEVEKAHLLMSTLLLSKE